VWEVSVLVRNRGGGFTMVEFAAAMSVGAIALVATASSVVSAAKISRTTAQTRATMQAMSTLLERVRTTPYADIQSSFGGRSLTLDTLGVVSSTGTATVSVTPIDTGDARWGCLEIRVTSTIGSGDQRSLVTYVCDRNVGNSGLNGASQ
jgi:type II secretory pathway pseudopilin PulG